MTTRTAVLSICWTARPPTLDDAILTGGCFPMVDRWHSDGGRPDTVTRAGTFALPGVPLRLPRVDGDTLLMRSGPLD